jgi:tetratricopeptide (TPR) repeat protein
MFKKIVVLGLILLAGLIAFIPMWTSYLADEAFKKPEASTAQLNIKTAIEWKKKIFMFKQARDIAERAIITFPTSKSLDVYIYSAAICAENEKKYQIAIHWYKRFLEEFKEHKWRDQAQRRLTMLVELHGDSIAAEDE